MFRFRTTQLEVTLGGKSIFHQALVSTTSAFQAVLGLDFLCTPPFQGILTSPEPCRLLYDKVEYPLKKMQAHKDTYKFFRITRQLWKTESYTLHPEVKAKALASLEVDPRKIEVDLFANRKNFTRPLYCKKSNCAFRYNWSSLGTLWANPPLVQFEASTAQFVPQALQVGPCTLS